MRPIELKIKGFISYKDEQVIDFTRFNQGIFLIEGDIGAGKTTIFDAMSFALYGEASGSDRGDSKETIEILHCNQSPKSEDTVVELTFSQSGKTYKVERRIHFPKSRIAEGGYGKATVKANLYEGKELLVSDAGKVTAKVNEIIGLNKDQFKKIIMLPQGEFKEFLTAPSGQKYEILKKIFDSSIYERYQEILVEARDRLAKTRGDYTEAIRLQMENSFVEPLESDGFSEENFLYGAPEILDNLKALVKFDEEKYDLLNSAYTEKDKLFSKLNEEKGKAEALNADIDALNKAKQHLEELINKTAEMEELKLKLGKVEVVVNKILGVIESRDSLEKKKKDLAEEIVNGKARLKELTEAVSRAQEVVKQDDAVKEKVKEIEAATSKMEALLKRYDDHDALVKKINDRIIKQKKDSEDLEGKKKEAGQLLENKGKLEEESKKLEGSDAEKEKLNAKVEETKKKCDAFSSVEALCSDIYDKEEELKSLGDEYKKKEGDALRRKEAYDATYTAFLKSQAVLIADKVEKEIESCESTYCPVCGSHLKKGIVYNFAKSDKVVDEKEYKNAQKAFEKAEEERSKANTAYENCKTEVKTLKEQAVKSFSEIFPDCHAWEDITHDYILSCKTKLTKEYKDSQQAYKKKEADAKRFKEVNKHLDELIKKEAEISKGIASLEAGIEKEKKELEGWKEDEKNVKAELTYESKAEANRQIAKNKEEAKAIQDLIDEHLKMFNKKNTELSGIKASLEEKEKQQESNEKELLSTKEKLGDALSENGFATEEAAKSVVKNVPEPDKWIKQTRTDINSYDNDKKNTMVKISELEEKTKGKEKVDLEDLQAKIAKADEERKECNKGLKERGTLLDNHRKTCRLVEDKKRNLVKTDAAWIKLDKLANLAKGANASGGKLSFDRYVMGANFVAILEEANRRLEILSKGAYQLRHKTTVNRSNSEAGLDVEIENMNQSGIISKASLSGGEKFLTSLSLALGLSDIAQNRYGGQTLDSLFIDEGFGSLDDESLDLAMGVLNSLTNNNNRLVGIISHVDSVDNYIPQKIVVKKKNSCSSISIQT